MTTYQEKYSNFECDFHSFSQSRQPFNVSSHNKNNIVISHISPLQEGGNSAKEGSSLFLRRMFSTSSLRGVSDTSSDFWKKVKTRKTLDSNNPFSIVNSFIKNNYNNKDIKNQIDFSLINSILNPHITNFKLTQEEFDILKYLKPVRFDLSSADKTELKNLIGKYVYKDDLGRPGVYVFTNKLNGHCYVGSSISLANRLSTGYFGPVLGKRKVDLALTETKLESFFIDLYILPEDLYLQENSNKSVNDSFSKIKLKAKSLILALEQILLLEKNPELNVLKVAGSPAGIKRSPESMLPSFTKNRRSVYIYDELNKTLICESNNRRLLSEEVGIGYSNFSTRRGGDRLYLNRFKFRDEKIENEEYTTQILNKEELKSFFQNLKSQLRKDIMKNNLRNYIEKVSRPNTKKIELTNVITGEVLQFKSLTDTALYIKQYGDKFSKCTAGIVTDYSSRNMVYKKTFKFKRI